MSSSDSDTSVSSELPPAYKDVRLFSDYAQNKLSDAAKKEWRIAVKAADWLSKERAAHAAVAKCTAKHKSFRELLNKRRRVTGEPSSMLRIVDDEAAEPNADRPVLHTAPATPEHTVLATPVPSIAAVLAATPTRAQKPRNPKDGTINTASSPASTTTGSTRPTSSSAGSVDTHV